MLITTSYFQFNRSQWSKLYETTSLMLKKHEITKLKKINENLSFEEIVEVYYPLSHLLNLCYISSSRQENILNNFLNINDRRRTPYIISIAGSVAAGKSTTASILQTLLSNSLENCHIELITTDGFLYSNQILREQNLIKKKGFPQSYDNQRLMSFILDLKSGASNIVVPVYSHLIYDILPEEHKINSKPDILILEGLNVLQDRVDNSNKSSRHFFISDLADFSIYIDAPENLLKKWYVNRFLKLRKCAFSRKESFFYNYSLLREREAINIANSLWNEINYVNLKENIFPTRKNAKLILIKSENHTVSKVLLRKI